MIQRNVGWPRAVGLEQGSDGRITQSEKSSGILRAHLVFGSLYLKRTFDTVHSSRGKFSAGLVHILVQFRVTQLLALRERGTRLKISTHRFYAYVRGRVAIRFDVLAEQLLPTSGFLVERLLLRPDGNAFSKELFSSGSIHDTGQSTQFIYG